MKIIDKMKLPDGREVVFRYPEMSDVKEAMGYVNSLVDEGAMISRTKKLTLAQEKKFFKEMLPKLRKKEQVFIIVEVGGKFAGMGNINKKNDTSNHVGVLGIGLNREYRRVGIGKKFMNVLLDVAQKELKCEIVELCVFGKNQAKKLYEKAGFVEYGRLPNGIKRKDGYDDDIFMYKVLKK